MRFFLILSLSIACVFGRYVSRADNNILDKCADGFQEFADCLKYKTIKLLDRVIVNRKPIEISNFLYLTHESSNSTTENTADEEDALNSADIDNKLTEVLIRRVRMLAQTKNLQVKLDDDLDTTPEGRKKKDKGGHIMMLMGAGAMMMHAAMSKIALIAGKALIVAKIALVISSIIGLKKLLSQDGGQESTQVIYKQAESSGHGSSGWHRSIDGGDNMRAQQMAYSAQVPES